MKKGMPIFGILLMVYSLIAWKVFASDIRTVTTTTTATTTITTTLCHQRAFVMKLICPSPSLPGTTVSIPLEIYVITVGGERYGAVFFSADISYDDAVFENPRVESNYFPPIHFTTPEPGVLRVSGSDGCYEGNVANILFDIKETAIPGTYSLSMNSSFTVFLACPSPLSACLRGISGCDVTVLRPTCACPEISVTGCIWGTVVYAPNQQPSQGMTVTLRRISPKPGVKMEATTDSDGCYLFPNLFDGKYIIELKGCKSRSSRRERIIDIVDFVSINKNIGWRHNRLLTRCFYLIRD